MSVLEFLYKCKVQMENDIENNDERKYPPLYSKDFVQGKLKAVIELISYIEYKKETDYNKKKRY